MITIDPDPNAYRKVAEMWRGVKKVGALTGAGISVGSGIPDFRSAGGLWSVFAPEEYATLQVFIDQPAKAWELYRALGRTLAGKKANPAHLALAELERAGFMHGVITQNIDNLHQQAGSRTVFEIHGDHQHLQCLQCDSREPVKAEDYDGAEVPCCRHCSNPVKPNVVLFGEPVRQLGEIERFAADCDVLLVIGTSAQVYPAASIPAAIKNRGGRIFEFNQEQVLGAAGFGSSSSITDVFFPGDVVKTLPLLKQTLTGR